MDKIETALGLMHSMICGGESHSAESIAAADAAREELKQLRAEVEQWKRDYAKVNVLNDSIAASVMQEVATRCAEIADEHNSCEGIAEKIAEAIRKEYGL